MTTIGGNELMAALDPGLHDSDGPGEIYLGEIDECHGKGPYSFDRIQTTMQSIIKETAKDILEANSR